VVDEKHVDVALEERMELAQKISSMVLSIRKKENIRVRQPLKKFKYLFWMMHTKQKLKLFKI
jgi:isoleucyl-tRNA synthetase